MSINTLPSRVLPDPATQPTIGIAYAARILGVGLRTAYAAAERGELPAVRVGRSVRVLTGQFLRQYQLTDAASE
ncbi:helix-turn-helix domain-containing protein [Dactylosporangium sp. NPDC006015]|uniref:helix-turn-helix domain-containing protein n=1 Tax=Dactylosporangium sp. NPDC006015 TaxID=3154576 RepID=UPI0033A41A5E